LRLVVGGDPPSGIRPAWKARHRILSRLIGRKIRKADLLAPVANESKTVKQVKECLERDLGGMFFDDDVFKGNSVKANGTRTIEYDCKRIARVSRARAIGLLMSYASSLGRAAYDREFA